MILSDFHVHTHFCDGKNSPEDVVLEAISRGMKKLGFSGHSYTSFDDTVSMKPERIEDYKREINRLKEKYKSQIKILCGIEQDYFSDFPAVGFDFIIGSVHFVKVNGKIISIDHTHEEIAQLIHECSDDPYEMTAKYFETVVDVVNKTGANIIGHFDLITKLNAGNKYFDESNERYINAYKSAVDVLVKTGTPFEINTGAISRGYTKKPYPSPEILKYISEKGGRVILSSDTHDKKTLMYKFPECEELAKSLGLKIVEL